MGRGRDIIGGARRSRSVRRGLVAWAAAIVLAGCAAPARSLDGVWSGAVPGGTRMLFAFRSDGTVQWTVFDGDFSETHEIRYRLDDSVRPHHLDLYGFDRGPLAGRTLYGIVAFEDGKRFRFDCEPGPAGAVGVGVGVRPAEFGPETVECARVE